MLPGETVTRAMKRVGGGSGAPGGVLAGGGGHRTALGKREKLRLQHLQESAGSKNAAGGEGGGVDGSAASAADPKLIDRFTEITDRLFAEGETDVYSTTREELERSAAMWLPKQQLAAAPGAPFVVSGAPHQQPAASAGAGGGHDDNDDDMFAEEDLGPAPTAVPAAAAPDAALHTAAPGDNGRSVGTAAPSEATAAPAAASGPAGDAQDQQPATDFSSWPIREIVRFLKENGVDAAGIVEKGDLVSQAVEVERQVRVEK